MKKILLLLMTFVTLSLAEPADRTGPYIAVGGGYAVFNDDGRMQAAVVDNSYDLNIIGGVFINKYLSVELTYDSFRIFENVYNLNTTKLSVIDVDAKAHYPFWKDQIDLYGAFGAGQLYWSENLNGTVRDANSGVLRGDIGVGFRALEWLTLNVGYRRYFFTLDHNTGTKDSDNNIVYKRYNMDVSSAYANIEVQF
ncbi:MAG: porin family protein [Thiovulaceae bacterium]|nr:porin family protein [Sulfurimonadaceae bacterium]